MTTNECPSCKLDRDATRTFSPCVVCSSFVCDACRGKAITCDGESTRAFVCEACKRVRRGEAIAITWTNGRPRIVSTMGVGTYVVVAGDLTVALRF